MPSILDQPLFRTKLGTAHVGDSLELLALIPDESVDLVVTSPPFALLREKAYGNARQVDYVDWLAQFAPHVHRILKPTGSYVLDLGGAYERGAPVRSVYQFRVLLRHVDECGFHLAEEFFWHNPSKLPSPIEWVNKRKIRAKDTVNVLWWLSKSEWPKANVSHVLAPYSARMKTLLRDPAKFYTPKERPSGHSISAGFAKDNGGAIPSNLLQVPNTESNGDYLRLCKQFEIVAHPARFPLAIPEFFIKFLTDPGDFVLDIFGGSGTSAEAAEKWERRWQTIDLNRDYVIGSVFRFATSLSDEKIAATLEQINGNICPVLSNGSPGLFDAIAVEAESV